MTDGALFDAPTGGTGSSGGDYFAVSPTAPLAARMRPRSLDEVAGQDHVLAAGKPLRRLIEGSGDASVILYGPPGTGKTTIASLISQATARKFVGLSALNSGVKEVRAVIDQARRDLIQGMSTVLFIDEVHRFSKTQQDALLAAVENRVVLLVVAPLLSRSLIVKLESLDDASVRAVLRRALVDERGLGGRITASDAAIDQLVALSGGDARRSLTYLEAAAESVPDGGELSMDVVAANIDRAVVRYDRDGDQHYDVASAFIKSIRGSDVDAAVHYLARMLVAGEDPRFVARRLVIAAAEDVGLADPQALSVAVAAAEAVQLIGMPEARIPLAEATIYLATAPKSNAAYVAIDQAMGDVRAAKSGVVPPHLRDGHYAGAQDLGNAVGYVYPHDDPHGVVAQQYLPDSLAGVTYYQPTMRGNEGRLAGVVEKLRALIRGEVLK